MTRYGGCRKAVKPAKPREIVTYGAGFLDLCRRAEAGEFAIEAVSTGRTPAQWVSVVRWPVAKLIK